MGKEQANVYGGLRGFDSVAIYELENFLYLAKNWVNKEIMVYPKEIIAATANVYGVSVDDIIGRSRKRAITDARHVAIYLTRHNTLLTMTDIGDIFGRDHATVIHSINKVEDMLKFDRLMKENYRLISKKIQSNDND